MNKSTRTIILGVVALIVLGGAVLLLTLLPGSEAEATEPPATAEPVVLLEETYLTVTDINITLASGESYSISPIPGDTVDYKMNTAAEVFPWDMTRVRDAGVAALRVSADETLEESATSDRLQAYGLDKPASRVKLTRTDGTTTELLIGRQAPIGTHYYAMRAGTGTVCLIRAYTAERLLRTADDMRDYSLFKGYPAVTEEGEEITEDFLTHFTNLTITDPEGETLEIGRFTEDEKTPAGVVRVNTYYLKQPLESDGHDFSIKTYILEPLLTLSVARIYEKSPADWSAYGLDRPHVLTMRDEEGWELELHIGSLNKDEEGGRFLRVAGTDYVLLSETGGDYRFLDQNPFYLRAPVAWGRFYDIVGIDEIIYEYDGKRRVQTVSAPGPSDADVPFESALDGTTLSEDNGRRLYLRLVELTVEGPYEDALPSAAPDAVFTLRMKDGTEHSLALYSVNGGRHYAVVTDGENQYAYVNTTKLDRVFEALDIVDRGEVIPS